MNLQHAIHHDAIFSAKQTFKAFILGSPKSVETVRPQGRMNFVPNTFYCFLILHLFTAVAGNVLNYYNIIIKVLLGVYIVC